jgi:hypothetical protein
MIVTEEWVPVEEFRRYSVNTLGQVRNESTGRIMRVRTNQYGVPYVGLMVGGGHRQCVRSLPRLVATAFVPRPNDVFDTPINLNGDRTDCRAENLMWRPRQYAIQYINQFDDPYENPINVPIRDVDTGEEYSNSMDAACANGLLEREVVLSILNRTLTWPTYQHFVIVD